MSFKKKRLTVLICDFNYQFKVNATNCFHVFLVDKLYRCRRLKAQVIFNGDLEKIDPKTKKIASERENPLVYLSCKQASKLASKQNGVVPKKHSL